MEFTTDPAKRDGWTRMKSQHKTPTNKEHKGIVGFVFLVAPFLNPRSSVVNSPGILDTDSAPESS